MALHVGTYIDGAMHGADGMGDMASYPLDFLVSPAWLSTSPIKWMIGHSSRRPCSKRRRSRSVRAIS
jgi:hypothetical protein